VVNKRRREKRGLDAGFPRWQKGRSREKECNIRQYLGIKNAKRREPTKIGRKPG